MDLIGEWGGGVSTEIRLFFIGTINYSSHKEKECRHWNTTWNIICHNSRTYFKLLNLLLTATFGSGVVLKFIPFSCVLRLQSALEPFPALQDSYSPSPPKLLCLFSLGSSLDARRNENYLGWRTKLNSSCNFLSFDFRASKLSFS